MSPVSVGIDHAVCGCHCLTGWCDDCVGGGRSGERDSVPVLSCTEVHTVFECVNTLCCLHITSECDKQNS